MLLFHLLFVLFVLCGTSVAAVAGTACKRPADIVILLDTSGSISDRDFPLELSFVMDLIRQFHVSPTTTRISVVSYSTGVREEFGLASAGGPVQGMLTRVARLHFTRGQRLDSHAAISYASGLLTSQASPHAARLILYITSRRATSPRKTLEEAEKARKQGLLLLVVGVGHAVDWTELSKLATRPSREFLFRVPAFSNLAALARPLSGQVCSAPLPVSRSVVAPCRRPADLVFLVDTSRSIFSGDFPLQLSFVQDIIKRFYVSFVSARFAVISYSQGYKEEFGLQTYTSSRAIVDAVGNIPFTQGGRIEGGLALKQALSLLNREARKGTAQIIIYITNGRAHDRVLAQAEAKIARRKGILVFTVGVGKYSDLRELRQLAYQDSPQFVATADSFASLNSLASPLANKVCTVPVPARKRVVQCKRAADIVFLLDTSRSIFYREFPFQLEFVQEVMDHFHVSASTTRFAAVSYSQGYREEFGLSQYRSASRMQEAVGKIPFSQGGRMDSHQALKHARGLLARQGREGAVRIIIYITSGRASDRYKALQEAAKVKKEGILLFAVGVGRYMDYEELGQVATLNNRHFVFSVDSFDGLHALTQTLAPEVCSAKPAVKQPVVRCRGPAELVFLVDTSRSIYPLDFPLELGFVQEVIEQFHISPSTTRVAVVSFSKGYKKEFGLEAYQTADALQEAVGKIPFTAGGTTDTHAAIRFARDNILRQSRAGATRIMIVITDGRSTVWFETLKEASQARAEGILMFAVGVGTRLDRWELGQMATNDTPEFVHLVSSFASLSDFGQVVGKRACAVTPSGSDMPSTDNTTITTIPATTPTPATTPEQTTLRPTTPEQTTPEQSTPEQTTPEQSTPEQSTPEQSTPKQSTPEETTPEQYTPEQSTPEQTTPYPTTQEQTTQEQTTPEQSTPEQTTPEQSTPEQSTPEQTTPEQSTPEQSTPEQSTPEETTPEQSTPEETTPEQSTPEETTPEQSTPEQTTPEQSTPEETTPEQSTPEQSTPEETTPEQSTPEQTTPEQSTPEETTPYPTTPEQTTPEQSTPEQTTPEQSTPEQATPEQSTPEETTPEQSTPEESTPEETTPEQSTPEQTTPEQSTPKETTPYPTTPEQTTPEQSTPEQYTPEQSTPEETTPYPTTPEQTTLEQSTTEQSTPEQSTPEQTTPEQSTPKQTTPEQSTPEETTPEQSTPEETTPYPTTPEQTTPEQSTPEKSTPEQSTPEQSTPEQSTPDQSTPEQSTPEQTTPEQTTPEQSTPEQSTPEQSTPKQSTPEQSTPKQSTQEQSTPEQSTPEQSTPEQTTPEQSTPEQSTPEQSTPENSTPPATSPAASTTTTIIPTSSASSPTTESAASVSSSSSTNGTSYMTHGPEFTNSTGPTPSKTTTGVLTTSATPTSAKSTTAQATKAHPKVTKPVTARQRTVQLTAVNTTTAKPTTAQPTTANPAPQKRGAAKRTTAKSTIISNPDSKQTKRGADVVFVLDRSSSVDRSDFSQQLAALQDIVAGMDLTPGQTQVATVSYGPDVKVEFPLKAPPYPAYIQDTLGRIRYTGGITLTGNALNTVRKVVLSPAQGARGPEVPRSVVLLTNGMSQNALHAVREANLLKSEGILIIAVGIGPNVDPNELESIASHPSQQYAYHLKNHADLQAIRQLLTKKACHN